MSASSFSCLQPTELGRNVPNDQHTTQGVLPDRGAHELEGKIHILRLLILDPFVEVASSEDDIIEQPTALGDLNLEARLVQVLSASFGDLVLVVLDAVELSVGVFRKCYEATHAQ